MEPRFRFDFQIVTLKAQLLEKTGEIYSMDCPED